MKKTNNKKLYLLFAAIPLIGIAIFSIFAGQSPFKVFLPNDINNDVWFYYKQIEAIIHKLYPRGFFSYNEVAPSIGGLASWSPLIYLPYAIVGRIIGWNFYSPIIINLLFMVVAFFLWFKLTDNDLFTSIIICVLYCFTISITGYVYSGMVEALFYGLIIVYVSVIFSNINDNKKFVISLTIAIVMSCMRPYCILLFPLNFQAGIIRLYVYSPKLKMCPFSVSRQEWV